MKKKPLIVRVRRWIAVNIVNRIKYFNVKWCFDEDKCINKTKDCLSCSYYIDYHRKG